MIVINFEKVGKQYTNGNNRLKKGGFVMKQFFVAFPAFTMDY